MADDNSKLQKNNNRQNVIELYTDFRYYAEIPFKLLGITRFNAKPPNGNKRLLLNFYSILLNILLTLGIAGEFIYIIKNTEEFKDFLTIIKCCAYVSYSTLSYAKILKLLYDGALVEELVQQIQIMYPNSQKQCRNSRIGQIIQPYRQWTRFYVVNFYIIALIAITCYSFVNILAAGISYLQEGALFQGRLPFLIYLPFDIETPKNFAVAYIYESWTGVICAQFQLACDALFFFVVQQLIIQFELIGAKLRDFRTEFFVEDSNSGSNGFDNNQHDKYIVKIIQQHQQVLSMVNKTNVIFEFSVFITFLSAGTLICFVVFLAKFGNDYTDLLKNCCFLVYEICQIWLISSLSYKLKEKSLTVAHAAYEIKWYNNNVRFQRSLCLIIMRSQRAATIKGYTFKDIDMEHFVLVMTIAYKFLAALNAMFD